ncbi:Photosystem I assembly protein Ycf3 [subsurface metagenome]
MIYKAQGNYPEALKRYEEALQIDEQLGDLANKAGCLNNIASIHYAQGNYPEALKRYEEALQILNVQGLSESPNAKIIKENIEFIKDS